MLAYIKNSRKKSLKINITRNLITFDFYLVSRFDKKKLGKI